MQQMEDQAFQRAREEGVASKPLLSRTRTGGVKPGGSSGERADFDLADYDSRNVNMGDLSNRRSDNPLQAMFDLATNEGGPKKK